MSPQSHKKIIHKLSWHITKIHDESVGIARLGAAANLGVALVAVGHVDDSPREVINCSIHR